MRVVVLSGGVGGAKLVDGMARALPSGNVTAIVNTGDDFDLFGLHVSPDLDTVCYTLAGMSNPDTGWGRKDETWHVLGMLREMGAPTWFALGDRDLATHLDRTRLLGEGRTLSEVTRGFCADWGVKARVLPMSDDPVHTLIVTREMGTLPFQEYFVKYHFRPSVTGMRFVGLSRARPAPGVIQAILQADLVLFAPSNPFVSLDPILGVRGVRQALTSKLVVAVSPIVGGEALKGPAAKMFRELGQDPSPVAVLEHYRRLVSVFVLDEHDVELSDAISRWGVVPLVTDTIMKTAEDRLRLAGFILQSMGQLRLPNPVAYL
jgi:LPPG:FO 2-phospho-L-lactate transferase